LTTIQVENNSPKTNMAMENPPFEDVFPIEKGGFSNVMLVFGRVLPRSFPPKKTPRISASTRNSKVVKKSPA